MLQLDKISKDWTLFLDRDGVINHEKHQDYIHTWEEFRFYEGAKEAFSVFRKYFRYIIIVTNQRGIGKGVTKKEDLLLIHKNMIREINLSGGWVDAVYYCPELNDDHPNRKPNAGMGLQAKNDFPAIDLSRSLMIGNTLSDMQFGRNLGAKTIFLPTTRPEVDINDERIDAVYESLAAFAAALKVDR